MQNVLLLILAVSARLQTPRFGATVNQN